MRKMFLSVKVDLVVIVDDSVAISKVLDNIKYCIINDPEGASTVLDCDVSELNSVVINMKENE